jgi:hypothetical protein
VDPNGKFGSLFGRFLHGSNPLPLPIFRDDRPNASRAAELAISNTNKTPFDILGKADKKWKREHGDKLFGSSFLAPTPSVWANQWFGLICQTNLSNHIRASLTKIKYNNLRSTSNTISPATSSNDNDHQADYNGWKFYDSPLDGEPALNDESHGHDTASLEIIDGSLSQTT